MVSSELRRTHVGALTGVSSSFVAVVVAHPWESIKVRMQSQRHGWRLFASAPEAWALARAPMVGLLPHLALYLPMNTVRFGVYERAKPVVGWTAGLERPAWWMPYAAGACAGVAVAATIHPLFVVKTFQQAHRTGPREAARRLLSTHGPRGLVLTWPLSFVRFAVALSVFFGSYDQIKSRVVGDSTQRPGAATFALRALSGGLSGILTW